MRIHQVDLLRTLPGLHAWASLTPETRRAWVLADGNKTSKPGAYGADEQALLDAGLLDETATGLRRIGKRARGLRVVLRTAERCRVLAPDADPQIDVRTYVAACLTQAERAALLGNPSLFGWDVTLALAQRVASRSWVEELMEARPATWEKPRLRGPRGGSVGWEPLLTPTVHADLVRLVREVVEAGGVRRFSDLFQGTSLKQHRMRAAAIQAAFRYLVLFPRLGSEDLQLEVGLAPGVAQGIGERAAAPRPEVVDAEVEDTPAFWVHDMLTVLLDAAAGETRVKANGRELYQKSMDRLLAALSPLPPLVERWAQTDDGHRLHEALWGLQLLDLLRVEIQPNGRRILRPSPASRAWLAGSAEARLTELARVVRGERDTKDPEDWWDSHRNARRLAPHVAGYDLLLAGVSDEDLCAAIRAALAEIPAQGAIRLRDWLMRQRVAANPLSGTGPGGHAFAAQRRQLDWVSPEECEEVWTEIVSSAIAFRLIPLGGVALGEGEAGPCLALTSVGRYLIRASDAFELPQRAAPKARIVVQPSFDVVFLGPAPEHEALLAPFADRVGQGVGTLFHLSRTAATRAAAAGLTGEEALQRLRRAQDGPLPDNVERSVRDWFGRIRTVEAARALVLRCAEEETADRVMAAGGTHATRLGPLVVELPSAQVLGRIRKKLAAEGVLVGHPNGSEEGPKARSTRSRRARRRRW